MTDDEIIAAARADFLDEADALLRQFEAALLVMETDPGDRENIDAAFRAAHTIKGSGGLFGYDAVVDFTHGVETLLDAVRAGARALDADVIAALLDSRDQMALLLDEVRTGAADDAVARRSAMLGARLRQLIDHAADPAQARVAPTGAAAPAGGHDAAPGPVTSAAQPGAAGAAPAPAGGTWHLSLRFGLDALRNGIDPLAFIRYLATLGEVRHIATLHDAVPPLEALDAEDCRLGFEIRFDSAADRAQIEDVFEFAREDCDIVVLAPDATPADYDALLAHRCGDDADALQALRSLLREQGAAWVQPAASAPSADTTAADTTAADTLPADTRIASARTADARIVDTRAMDAPTAGARAAGQRPGPRDRRVEEARFVRVRADKLDRLIGLIGELVIAGSGAQLAAAQHGSPALAEAAQRICDLVEEARDGALGLRMVPIGETFGRFQRVVRDIGRQLGKDIELSITGGDTELDKAMVETIADPLMHLVRNSLDHGIEPAHERLAAGKAATGRLTLQAYHEAGSIVIEVGDDGRGLDRDRILAKAVERGLADAGATLADHEVFSLVFLPGFSTAEQVTDISGRGVGMDVVKRNIEALRGQIGIRSEPGRGTVTQIRLPLTLAMIDGFLVGVGGVQYVLPLAIVSECIEVPTSCADGSGRTSGLFDLRGEVLPWLDLARFHGHAPAPAARRSLVVVRDGATRVGLIVDRLHGEHQTVIKPLSSIFRHLRAISGSTILGSGEVALVLDVPALVTAASQANASHAIASQADASPATASHAFH